jgi:heat shock protein HspQ
MSLQEIQNKFKEIENVDFNSLIRVGKDYEFKDIEYFLIESHSIIKKLIYDNEYWTKIPTRTQQFFQGPLTEFINSFKRVINFNPKEQNPEQNRNNIADEVRNRYHDLLEKVINPYKIYLLENNLNIAKIDKQAEKADGQIKHIERLVNNADTLLEQLRTRTAEQVVTDYVKIFRDEAKKHSNFEKLNKNSKRKWGSAEKWLLTGLLLIFAFIIFIILAVIFLKIDNENVNYSLVVLKISVITVFIFLIRFAFKQYSINKNLFVLNKHRENTLSSYKLFIESLSEKDTDIRNAIMMQVAKSIYDHGKSGYIIDKSKDMESPSIIELIRTIPKINEIK